MATAGDIVTAALRDIGVVASDEPATAEQMQDGLAHFGRLVNSWKARGVDIGLSTYESNTTLILEDEYHDGLICLLAVRLARQYQSPLSAEQRDDADMAWRLLWANFGTIGDMRVDRGLQGMPSSRFGTLRYT